MDNLKRDYNVYTFYLKNIKGVRLQSLVNMSSGDLVGYQVFTLLSVLDIEDSFESLYSELHISFLLWRLEQTNHMVEEYLFNISLTVLTSVSLWPLLIKMRLKRNIVLEIQDPQNNFPFSVNNKQPQALR